MAVAGDARARHRRVDQAAVPYRPNTRMGAQAAAIPPATPIRTDRPPRPQNDPAPLTRLGLGRAARRRVQAPASAPTPNRLTRGASGALPTTNHANPRASACPQSTPTPPRSGKNTTARPPDAQPTPRSTQPDTPKRPHRGTPGRLLQATRFGSYRKIEAGIRNQGQTATSSRGAALRGLRDEPGSPTLGSQARGSELSAVEGRADARGGAARWLGGHGSGRGDGRLWRPAAERFGAGDGA